MNFVGKILIFMIFIMSLVFMSFAVAVYATHQNWRMVVERPRDRATADRPAGLKFQLEDERKRNADLEEQFKKYKADVDREETLRKSDLAKLTTERDQLVRRRDELQKQRDALVEKDKTSVATLAVASQNLAKLTAEVEELRVDLRNTQKQRDQHFTSVVAMTDKAHQDRGDLRRLKERRMQLADQVAAQKRVLTEHGLNEHTPSTPPQVSGKVVAVNRNDMVEVDIGTDDGIRTGYTLEIFRGTKYLGRMRVMTTSEDKSVGQILPSFKKGVIQEGDNVITRFKLS